MAAEVSPSGHRAAPMPRLQWGALGKAALQVNLAVAAIWSLWQLAHFLKFFSGHDFIFYYRPDAMRALDLGWSAFYTGTDHNVFPPLHGLVVLPFLFFSPSVGYILWTLASLFALVLTWRLAGNGKWWQLALMALFFPVLYTLALGQVVLLVVALVTLAWWLSERNQGLVAGFVLSLATLKPQLILLLPLVLLLAGHKREFAGFLLGSLAIGLLSLWLVGIHSIHLLLENTQWAAAHHQAIAVLDSTVLIYWLPAPWGLMATVGAGLLTLVAAWRLRGQVIAPVYALGLLGSLLVTPYSHWQDLTIWMIAALLLWRSLGVPRLLAAAGVLVSWLVLFGVPLISLGGLLVILLRAKADGTSEAKVLS